ncbi:MAG: ROK family protein [Oscillospiraceae bacterium]|nr:ROK family protein [Oscillospiraceae bacterium]
MRIAVLDIGGTAIKAGIWQDDKLLENTELPYDASLGAQHMTQLALQQIKSYLPFEAVGISTAGLVDSQNGIIKCAGNIPGYPFTNWKNLVHEAFGVPCFVENDVNAVALAEGYYGAAKDMDNYLCVAYGTGIGGAAVLNGRIYTGNAFASGEFGWIVTHGEQRKPDDLASGIYERYASTSALVRMAKEYNPVLNNGRVIFAEMKNPEVQKIIDAWIGEIIVGLTGLIHIFDPSGIVLGGGIMREPYVYEQLKARLPHYVIEAYKDVKLVQAQLGNTAGMYGAARAVVIGLQG